MLLVTIEVISKILHRVSFCPGVSVYAFQRSPDPKGAPRSPWALKKLNKCYRNKPTQQKKCLMNEAAVLRTIEHPNIIGFRGYLESEGTNPVLLMEKGDHSLLDLIEERNGASLRVFHPNEIVKVMFLSLFFFQLKIIVITVKFSAGFIGRP